MTPAVGTVAARIAAKTWGGLWAAEKPKETREPDHGTHSIGVEAALGSSCQGGLFDFP